MRIHFSLFILMSLGFLCVCGKPDSDSKCSLLRKRNSLLASYHDRIGIPLAARQWPDFAPSLVEEHSYYAGLLITLHNADKKSGERTFQNDSVCGAALISANRLLTAAHCWRDHLYQGSSIRVILGSRSLLGLGGVTYTSNKVTMHPSYDPYNYLLNNIAMVVLPSNLYYTNRISPVALPMYIDSHIQSTFMASPMAVIGYADNPDSPRVDLHSIRYEASVSLISHQECRNTYGDVINLSHLCTAAGPALQEECICDGDSGSPLVVNMNGHQVFIGIAIMSSRIGCPKRPVGVFTRIRYFLDFIYDNID